MLRNRLDLHLYSQQTSSLDHFEAHHSEARHYQGRRVKQEFKNERDQTAPFWMA